jgi:hypothetical protein
MSIRTHCSLWLARSGRRRARPAPAKVRPFRPSLEGLEGRDVPSHLLVTSALDTGVSGDGSLRGEILAAQPGDTIRFAHSLAGQTLTLNSELLLNKDLTIRGLGADQLTISGGGTSRVFEIAGGATDTISGLIITNGMASDQGGGVLNHGTLTLSHDILEGNNAVGDSVRGGGIYNDGTLTVAHSVLTGNVANGNVASGGCIYSTGTATVDHCTLSGNAVTGIIVGGGAITNSGGTLMVDHSTLTDNHADDSGSGGGIFCGSGVATPGSTTVDHSTLSGNTALGLQGRGGGIEVFATTLTLDNSTVIGNSAGFAGADLDAALNGTVIQKHSVVG